MVGISDELLLPVPADLVLKCQGLALDMGGSTMKLVFRTKEDVDKLNSDNSALSQLHMISVGRNEIKQGLDYVRQRAYYGNQTDAKDDVTTLNVTGYGCSEFGKVICEALNVRLENLIEFDCFVKAFIYFVDRLPRRDLLEPFDVDALVEPIQVAHGQMSMLKASQAMTEAFDVTMITAIQENIPSLTGRPAGDGEDPPSDKPLSEAESDMFPCMLVMCGSGFGCFKVEKDGSFKLVDISNRGGKAFIGVGSLLTGCKTFGGLIELASNGDQHNVNQYSNDLIDQNSAATDENDSDVYKKMADMTTSSLVFCFGKAAGDHGEMSQADLATAWLNYSVLDLTQTVHISCAIHNIKRAFFCGGFCNSPFVRHVITTEMARRNLLASMLVQKPTTVAFDFIKPGQHLGALGCIIDGVEQ